MPKPPTHAIVIVNGYPQAIHATPSTPEEFATLLRTDAARYAKIARAANVKVD